jgi:Fe-S cluster assembly scaffold protein SufB
MEIINPHGTKKIIIKKNETLNIWLEDLEPKSREFSLEIELLGDNAQCIIEGRIHCKNSDKKVWNITQIFRGKNQIGKINLQGVAEENSNLELNATGIISRDSSQATALISEKILLFEKAKGQLLPVLTVQTDDVKKANHAASITPVKPANLLFLTSRGIPIKEAENILKKGFLK